MHGPMNVKNWKPSNTRSVSNANNVFQETTRIFNVRHKRHHAYWEVSQETVLGNFQLPQNMTYKIGKLKYKYMW